jgi:hypothetical protein
MAGQATDAIFVATVMSFESRFARRKLAFFM